MAGFDVKVVLDGISRFRHPKLPARFGRRGASRSVQQSRHFCAHPQRHREGADRQLAADPVGFHRHRTVSCIRLHHLRRPAKFHAGAAAFGGHLVRHPGRDADRRLADRRELRHRHEPAHGGRQTPAARRCHRRHAARHRLRRHRLLLGAEPVQRRQHDQAGGPAGRLDQVYRRLGVFPAGDGAGRHDRLRLPPRRRHRYALRPELPPDHQEFRAVGDVPGLDGGLGVLLVRLALQRHLPGRAAQARRRDPHHQPDRQRRLRCWRPDAEAADRGSRGPVRDRGLEGL